MRRRGGSVGCGAVIAGTAIILALVLPGEVWWFLLASALIGFGIWYLRKCGK